MASAARWPTEIPESFAGPGAHKELPATSNFGDHANAPVRAGLRFTAGEASDGVLITDIARDTFADRYYGTELAGEEGFAARGPGKTAENVRIPVRIVFIEDADCIHKSAGLPGEFQNIAQAVSACIVAAITNNDQHYLVPSAGLQSLV